MQRGVIHNKLAHLQCVNSFKMSLSPLEEDRFLSPNDQYFNKYCDHDNQYA